MTQRVEGLLYSFACELLACPITAFYFMFEGRRTQNVKINASHWLSKAEEIAQWLADERFRAKEMETSRINLEKTCDDYGNQSLEVLDRAACTAHVAVPAIDEALWFYHFYCEWFLQILMKFDNLMRSETLQSTEFYEAYQANSSDIDELRRLLYQERPNFERHNIPQSVIEEINSALEYHTRHLASLWQQAVWGAVNSEIKANKG